MKNFCFLIVGFTLLQQASFGQSNFWGACTQSEFTNEATAMAFDSQNNVYITGYITGESAFGPNITFNSAQGNGDIYVAKYSAQGTLLWVKKYGGSFSDRAYDIKVDGQGNILVTGQFFGTVNFDGNMVQSVNNSKDIFLIKMSPAGDVLWAIGEGGPMAENVYGLAVDSQNNIILTGQFQGASSIGGQTFNSIINPELGAPSYDLFISKYDTNGNPIWVQTGTAKYEDRGMAVLTDNQNNIYVSGQFSDTLVFAGQTYNNMGYNVGFLTKLSPSGEIIWFNKMTGGMVLPYDLSINSTGDIHVCGDFLGALNHQTDFGNQILTNAYYRKVFAIKVNPNGQIIWQRALGSDNEVSARAIAIDNTGKVFIGGHFRCALSELQEQNTALFNSVGFRDIYLWTLAPNGTTAATKQMGGQKNDYCYDLALNSQNQVFVCGSFTSHLNLPQNNSDNIVSNQSAFNYTNGLYDIWNFSYVRLIGDESANSFVLSGFNEQTNDYNYFYEQAQDSLFGYISPLDTVEFCGGGWIYYQPLTHYFAGPDYNYLWSTGSTNDTIWINESDDYSVFVERADQCVSDNDTVFVLIHSFPDMPLLSDNIVQYTDAPLIDSPCTNITIYYVICAPDTFNIWLSPILPNETIVIEGSQTLYTNTDANPYWTADTYTVSVSDENCTTVRCFSIIHDTILPKEIDPLPLFVDSNIVNDTLEMCYLDWSPIRVLDLLTNPGMDTSLIPEAATVSELYQITVNGITVPVVVPQDYHAFFQAVETGWYILNYELITGYNNTCGIDTLYNQRFDSLYVIVHPLPTAQFTLSYSSLLCPNGSVFITTSNTYPGFTWSGPSVDWISPSADSAQVSLAGGYSYSGTLVDSITGCSSDFSSSIYLEDKVPPNVLANPLNAIICPYDSIEIFVPNIYLEYDWTGPSGTSLSLTNTHVDAEQGFYYCTVLDDEGCYLTSPPIELTEYSTPYLEVEPNNVICGSGTVIIHAIIIGDGVVNWLPPLSGSSASVTVNAPGWYAAELTQCGITVVDSIQILDGSFSVNLIASDTLICFSNSVTVQGSYLQGNYEWNNGMAGSPIIEVNESGFYFATVNNDFGCEAISDTIYIEFVEASTPPNNEGFTICEPQNLTLSTNQNIVAQWYNANFDLLAEDITYTQFFSENTLLYAAYPQNFCPPAYGTYIINFEEPIAPDVDIIGPEMICVQETATYSVAYSGTVAWNLNGQYLGNDAAVVLSGSQISSGGLLTVSLSNTCFSTVLNLNISAFPTPIIDLPNFDTIICQNTNFALNANSIALDLSLFYNGVWNSYAGETIFIGSPTTMLLAGTDANGCLSDTATYNIALFSSEFNIIPVYIPTCAPDSLILTTNMVDSDITWTHGTNVDQGDTISYFFDYANVSQIFAETIDSNGCMLTDSIIVILSMPAYYDLPIDTAVCIGSFVYTSVLIEIIDGQLSYTVLDSVEVFANSTVEIIIDNGICPTTLTYSVNVVECPSDFPNVITPNGDGVNDFFLIPNAHFEPNNHLIIINRWGNVMYETHGYQNTFTGAGITDGVYFYIYTPDAKLNREVTVQGYLHIMR